MKCYVWVHSHLSWQQKAIQASHVVAEITQTQRGQRWARSSKTLVLFDGGNTKSLQDIYHKVFRPSVSWAKAEFIEDGETLGGLMTAVAVLVPKWEWGQKETFTEARVLDLINGSRLA